MRNCCDLAEQTINIEWGSSGCFSTIFCTIKGVVLFGTLKVLWKDNASTKYVADCRYRHSMLEAGRQWHNRFEELSGSGSDRRTNALWKNKMDNYNAISGERKLQTVPPYPKPSFLATLFFTSCRGDNQLSRTIS